MKYQPLLLNGCQFDASRHIASAHRNARKAQPASQNRLTRRVTDKAITAGVKLLLIVSAIICAGYLFTR